MAKICYQGAWLTNTPYQGTQCTTSILINNKGEGGPTIFTVPYEFKNKVYRGISRHIDSIDNKVPMSRSLVLVPATPTSQCLARARSRLRTGVLPWSQPRPRYLSQPSHSTLERVSRLWSICILSRRSPELKTVLKQIFCIALLKKNRFEILEDFPLVNSQQNWPEKA